MAAKFFTLLLTGVFALGFGAGGFFGGLRPLADIARNKWMTSDWQPVPARVLEVGQERHGKGSVETTVLYRYEVGGKAYEGSRIGLSRPSGDNIGTWQQDWHRTLLGARARQQPVTAWVDPKRPERALLDRNVRWSMVVFHIPFALLFTAIGAGALWAFAHVLFMPAAQVEREQDTPGPIPLQKARLEGKGLGLMAAFWNILCLPMAALVWMEPTPWVQRLAVTAFAAIGLWLAVAALRGRSLDARRFVRSAKEV